MGTSPRSRFDQLSASEMEAVVARRTSGESFSIIARDYGITQTDVLKAEIQLIQSD
jgi:hypothetical protein